MSHRYSIFFFYNTFKFYVSNLCSAFMFDISLLTFLTFFQFILSCTNNFSSSNSLNLVSKSFLDYLISISGIIELGLLVIIYSYIRKKINGKL